MKIKILISAITLVGVQMSVIRPTLALIPFCGDAAMCSIENTSLPINNITNCAVYLDSCYNGGVRVRSCITCNSGYTLTSATTTSGLCSGTLNYNYCKSSGSSGGGDDGGDTGGGDITDCAHLCDSCSSMPGRWMMVLGNPGYESKTTNTCGPKTNCECVSSTEYRCAAGYYGIPNLNGTRGCSECPDGGTSVAGNNSKKTNCYITGGSDNTGTFTYDPVCNYTE